MAHKTYHSAIPIQISVYPDHITFWNSGELPENWTVETLFDHHPSEPYNPLVANAFFRSGDIESWGRGYKRIMDAIKAAKLLPPHIKMLNGPIVSYYADIVAQLKEQKLNDRYVPIIQWALSEGKVTNNDVQSILKISRATAYRVLQQLEPWLVLQGNTGVKAHYIIRGYGD